jgi:hypothetical protein
VAGQAALEAARYLLDERAIALEELGGIRRKVTAAARRAPNDGRGVR